ncbi:hypothetical protein HLB44_05000 [Aquincola sp. S2]|uniref:Uncharacterized protein n=1 Tax=Pseudaquabacterium terrae TaxID=2732868 RepID=A0ABX2EB34_9BURK|nr:hypothetical protein [Aquabacterium terrae]NRF66336.1 hypothetical protein [Aquabacterium terrae]
MDARYLKTDVGRAALRERTPDLPRVARTLLLIIDGSRSGVEWLGLVAGSTAETLQLLVERGLIAAGAAPAAPSAAAARAASAVPAPPADALSSGPALAELLATMNYRDLYDEMTSQARPLLGLVAGYRVVLDIEKCNGTDELRVLANRFIEMVRKEKGAEAAEAFCRGLVVHHRAATPE